MCGVAGIFDLKGERAVDMSALKRMTDALAHRGPDGEGFFAAPGIGLGHRRLAIIDLIDGSQPFLSADRDGVVALNGEIYNYQSLKHELVQQGVRFRTNSDTEVLIEGLQKSGASFIDRLRAMFAFAWWNDRTKTLTLARDRLGEKPLYYAETADGFLLFASELGAIVASQLVDLRHSPAALREYFLYGYVPDPKSAYEGVFKLSPASTLTCQRGRTLALQRYWRPKFTADQSTTFEQSQQILRDLLDDAVAAQMTADVPLGAFLSGGVDSSSIVASMVQQRGGITTCTIGFDARGFDERDHARATSRRYATSHHETVVRLDATGLIDRIAGVYGEPFADPSALPTYEISAAARRYVKVALSGDGADEIFAGYRRYPFFVAEERIRRAAPLFLRRAFFGAAGAIYPKLDHAPRAVRLKTTLQSLGEDSTAAYARAISTALPDRLKKMLSPDFTTATSEDALAPLKAAGVFACDSPLVLAQRLDLETWLPGRMLTKVDRASMAHGLEVRSPFLDHRLVEWALSLPARFKLGPEGGKRVLKKAMEPRLDRQVLYRAKQGFSPPVARWLRDARGPLDRLRESEAWKRSGWFSPREVERMMGAHRKGAADYSQELWMLIMFDAFLRRRAA